MRRTSLRRMLCACLLAAFAAASAATDTRASGVRACGNEAGYGSAVLQSLRGGQGVRATFTAIARPYVESGHVAAWVGVGGPGEGPGGADEWLQVGMAGFAHSTDS